MWAPWGKASSLWRVRVQTQCHLTHWVGLLWTGDRIVAETSISQHTTNTTDRLPCPRFEFEPAIPASERPQTDTLVPTDTGIGFTKYYHRINICVDVGT